MAAVDSLVRLMTSQNADGLSLSSGQVPRLSKNGFLQPLSMPPVGAAMVETFVSEILSTEQIADAQKNGSVTVDYADLAATVTRRQGEGWSIGFKRRPPRSGGNRSAGPGQQGNSIPQPSPGPQASPVPQPNPSPSPIPNPVPSPYPSPNPVPSPSPNPNLTPLPNPIPPPPPPDPLAAAQLDRWLVRALEPEVSDLLVSAALGARLRVAGELISLPGGAITSEQLLALLGPALDDSHRAALAHHGSTDIAYVFHGDDGAGRFRVNLFRQASGLAAAFRPVRREPPTLAELRLPATLERLIGFPHGLVLVTGPTGSGKSTTLVALIEQLNRTAARHIITIEDPIEYEYTPARSLIHQRELGAHVDSFETGLRAALREAPDVILVGEMRDRATIASALTAAETGHLVLSTLHAASAAMAVERIVDVFPEHQQRQVRGQLAGSLRAVLTQQLLPAAQGGVVPVVELLISTAATAALIRDGKTHQLASAIQTGRDEGMIPLDRSLADRIEARLLNLETAVTVTLDGGAQLRELLSRRRG